MPKGQPSVFRISTLDYMIGLATLASIHSEGNPDRWHEEAVQREELNGVQPLEIPPQGLIVVLQESGTQVFAAKPADVPADVFMQKMFAVGVHGDSSITSFCFQ